MNEWVLYEARAKGTYDSRKQLTILLYLSAKMNEVEDVVVENIERFGAAYRMRFNAKTGFDIKRFLIENDVKGIDERFLRAL